MDGDDVLHRIGPGVASVHGTAIEIDGRGVLIIGPSGAGKSGLAAQLLTMDAGLICDDMVYLRAADATIIVCGPPEARPMLELRGIGLVPQVLSAPVPLCMVVSLEPSSARLPQEAWFSAHGVRVPLVRHPYRFDLAAKVLLWARAS